MLEEEVRADGEKLLGGWVRVLSKTRRGKERVTSREGGVDDRGRV